MNDWGFDILSCLRMDQRKALFSILLEGMVRESKNLLMLKSLGFQSEVCPIINPI